MGVTADRIKDLGLIDNIITEPLGGAHRDFDLMANQVKQAIKQDLSDIASDDKEQLIENRYQRLMTYGYC